VFRNVLVVTKCRICACKMSLSLPLRRTTNVFWCKVKLDFRIVLTSTKKCFWMYKVYYNWQALDFFNNCFTWNLHYTIGVRLYVVFEITYDIAVISFVVALVQRAVYKKCSTSSTCVIFKNTFDMWMYRHYWTKNWRCLYKTLLNVWQLTQCWW